MFSLWLWILGIIDTKVVEDNVQELGKNKNLNVEENIVKIYFDNHEDAVNFADNLEKFINK